jgi:uncharacterized protein
MAGLIVRCRKPAIRADRYEPLRSIAVVLTPNFRPPSLLTTGLSVFLLDKTGASPYNLMLAAHAASRAIKMAMKINDIPPEGLTLELKQKLDLFDTGTASTAFTATLAIRPTGAGVLHIKGRVQADPQLECSRCLNIFPYHIDSDLDITLAPEKVLGTAPEHELGRSELDTEFYQGEEIEPLDLVKEQLLITIPMVPLHRPDCKGLCPVCGTDLNRTECGCTKDSPDEFRAFSALKDLLKK